MRFNLHQRHLRKAVSLAPIIVIILSGLLIRWLFYKSILGTIMISDSPTYIDGAMSLYYHLWLNEYRPPVYPLLLMLSGVLFLWKNLSFSIIILQTALSVVNIVFIYKLLDEVFQKKALTIFTTLVISISFSIYCWDFMVLTESISILQITLISFFLAKYIKYRNPKDMKLILFFSGTAIFTKPFFLLLPVAVLLLIGSYLLLQKKMYKEPAISYTALIKGFCAIYLSIFIYCGINYAENQYFGFSSVGNVNTFGKILQYDMQNLGKNQALLDDIRTAFAGEKPEYIVNGKFLEPWHFIGTHHWNRQHYKAVGSFAKDIVLQHPVEYTVKSLRLVYDIFSLGSPFKDYIAEGELMKSNHANEIVIQLKKIVRYFEELYILLALCLIEMIFVLIFKPRNILRQDRFITLCLLTIILYHYFISAFLSYGDYCRLLAPCYPLVYIIICLYIYRVSVFALHTAKRFASFINNT